MHIKFFANVGYRSPFSCDKNIIALFCKNANFGVSRSFCMHIRIDIQFLLSVFLISEGKAYIFNPKV